MRAGIEKIIASAIQAAIECGELSLEEMPDPSVERPKDIENGDWASSVAMKLAKPARMNPRKIAEIICSHISDDEMIESTEIAGPGFINFKLKSSAFQAVIMKARVEGADFGRVNIGDHKRIQVEFVSANPTGPMHVGHGRWAALGNSLCNILDHAGWDVSREFYINDAGSQMDNFANSVDARYQQLCGIDAELPENGYGGSYVTAIAQRILDSEGEKWASSSSEERSAAFKEIAYKMMLDNMCELLASIGVEFDVWFSERSLYAKDEGGKSAIEKTLDELGAGGYLFEKDGAIWFRSTDFGDDKDRVLVKQDGSYTYFTPDIAYHQNKFNRGFDRVIDILGADHHDYVVRIKSAMEALGNGGKLDILLGQLVNLFRDGEAVRMSKRSGEMITFEELIEEVGADATKYLMLAKSADQPIDFDISVAKKQDSSNPVYYVQYAHARICSILRRAGREVRDDADLSLLVDPSEIGLARKISEFPEVVESCAKDFAPYRMTHYIEALAASFHQFYTNCPVLVDDAQLADARLYLCDATRNVIATALGLVGVTAPERM